MVTVKNIVISPNFLVWKFCEKAQFPDSFGRFAVDTIQRFKKEKLLKEKVADALKWLILKLKRNKYIKWKTWKGDSYSQLIKEQYRIIFHNFHNLLSITYNRSLWNISNIITKNWSILQISPTFQKVFDKKAMITYKRNKNLGELIGDHILQRGKVFKNNL